MLHLKRNRRNSDFWKARSLIPRNSRLDKISHLQGITLGSVEVLYSYNNYLSNGEPITTATTKTRSPKKYASNVNNLTVNLNTNNLTVNIDDASLVDEAMPEISAATIAKIRPLVEVAAKKPPMPSADKLSVPKSFDMFVDDLKSSSALPDNHLNSPHEFNLNNPTLKMMTSSVGDDLHKESSSKDMFKNRLNLNRTQNLLTNKNLTSSNFDLNEIQETSSPFRPLLQKTSLNQSYTILKKSIDFNEIEKQQNQPAVHTKSKAVDPKRNKFDSNESLDDNDEDTSSKCSSAPSNNEINLQPFETDDNLPRTVFNQTYTSWDANEDQLQAEAMKQQQAIQGIHATAANLTQEIRVEEEVRKNLNTTMDIIGKSTIRKFTFEFRQSAIIGPLLL